MINGKFFTGLPPKMVDRSGGANRQQTNFFWPDDTERKSAVGTQRRDSVQSNSTQRSTPTTDQSNSEAETRERFKKEFTKSSIHFYDYVDQKPNAKNANTRNSQKLEDSATAFKSTGKEKKPHSSNVHFYDYVEDLNNVPKTDKNNKVEVERNRKNSPKLQNKHLPFDTPNEGIHFIENDVRNMAITPTTPRRRNTFREVRPKYNRTPPDDDCADYSHRPRRYHEPPSTVNRYIETDHDFNEYHEARHRNPRKAEYYDAEPPYSGPPRPPRARYHEDRRMNTYHTDEVVHQDVSGDRIFETIDSQSRHETYATSNDGQNSEQSKTTGSPHKHLVSNICFSDTETPSASQLPPTRRNIRSSAVNKVSVGLPD